MLFFNLFLEGLQFGTNSFLGFLIRYGLLEGFFFGELSFFCFLFSYGLFICLTLGELSFFGFFIKNGLLYFKLLLFLYQNSSLPRLLNYNSGLSSLFYKKISLSLFFFLLLLCFNSGLLSFFCQKISLSLFFLLLEFCQAISLSLFLFHLLLFCCQLSLSSFFSFQLGFLRCLGLQFIRCLLFLKLFLEGLLFGELSFCGFLISYGLLQLKVFLSQIFNFSLPRLFY